MRGRPKRKPGAPCRTASHRNKTACEAFASRSRDCLGDLSRQHSLAHQASARLNIVGGKGYRRIFFAEGPARRESARRPSHIGPRKVRIISSAVSQTVPGAGKCQGPTPLGLKTATPCQPRAALAEEGSGKTQDPRLRGVRRCTGRLNATQPGVLAVSTPYIRGLTASCKGCRRKRRGAATLDRFPQYSVKVSINRALLMR